LSDDVVLKNDKLNDFIKAMKKPPTARVGILGSKNVRSGKSKSNATIGAAHEFGTKDMPQRSFLRIPISENLNKYLEASGAFNKALLAQVMKEKSFVPWMKKVAAVAEKIVLEAFDSSGFGKWPQLKPQTMAKKTNQQILVETGQLRNSITSEVKE